MILEEEKTIYVTRSINCSYVHAVARIGQEVLSLEAVAGKGEDIFGLQERLVKQINNSIEFFEETGLLPYEEGTDMTKQAASGTKKYPIIIIQ